MCTGKFRSLMIAERRESIYFSMIPFAWNDSDLDDSDSYKVCEKWKIADTSMFLKVVDRLMIRCGVWDK